MTPLAHALPTPGLSASSALPVSSMVELTFGDRLRTWRTARRYSQLALALEAGVSQRHLSFLESGRAGPSRDMVMHLAQVLQLPLRERNAWLVAAGLAPCFAERTLGDAAMQAIRQSLDLTLQHHEPLPALVVNRQWEVVMNNPAFERLLAALAAPEPPVALWQRVDPTGRRNLMRLSLHPEGLRPWVVEWPSFAALLMARLSHEVQADPTHTGLAALVSELRTWPDVAAATVRQPPDVPPPVMTLQLRHRGQTLSLFSMVCGFGGAMDLTTEELRLELMFPSDAGSAQFLREQQGQSPAPGS